MGAQAHAGPPAARRGLPFSASLDVVGHFTGTLEDLRNIFYIMADTPAEPEPQDLRVACLGGWFAQNLSPALAAAISRVCAHLGLTGTTELPQTPTARAASFVITASEGGTLHLPRLRAAAEEYDPATRDRLLAGAMLPASTYVQAQRFRRWFREQVHAVFEQADVLIAPSVMCEAPLLDDPTIMVGGKPTSARANLGLYTQPLSLPGLPVLCLPLSNTGTLPLGLQLVAAPGVRQLCSALPASWSRQALPGATRSTRSRPPDRHKIG